MNQKSFSKPIALSTLKVTDSFWGPEMELVRKEVIPYQWEILNDHIEGAAPSFCMHNFKVAGRLTQLRKTQETPTYPTDVLENLPKDKNHLEERFYGYVFQDSDFAKWIEAVGYSLTQHPDAMLEKIADEAIDIVCTAQQEDGYLDTYYIINNMAERFTNLRDNHELYCFGHLTEGAIAYYEATGKDKLLKAVERFADYIDERFGLEEGKCKGYPGHEIAEMALFRLYEATGKAKYLQLGSFFINERGKKPYYFDLERGVKVNDETQKYAYHQAHLPVREQKEAVGHAVRAVYLYSGMADLARLSQDETLYKACENLWQSIVSKKMYVTGGIGGTAIGEAFSFDYDLPNDTAYAETCASIGLVFFARRMLQIEAKAEYADIMERALFNGILSGMALDGKSFFYVNPLEVFPEACHNDERKQHVKPVRQKWFGCACCPPNIARLVSSIGNYAFTETEDSLFIHLYIGSQFKKQVGAHQVEVEINSDFPWQGKVAIKVKTQEKVSLTIALRIPSWCSNYEINFPQLEASYMKDGYLYLTQVWEGESILNLNFPMEIQVIKANPLVRENIGKVAVMRGPIVYCIEEADNGNNLHLVKMKELEAVRLSEKLEEGRIVLESNGLRLKQRKLNSGALYGIDLEENYEEVNLKWIPYYTWANRGEGEMQVWVRY